MSGTIPPLLSNSPPPPPSPDDEEDDEFGNFTISNDFSFTYDEFISSPSPSRSPKIENIKLNSNITEESENDESKAVTEDINNISKKVSSNTDFSPRIHSDMKYHSNSLCMKSKNENDVLRIISNQLEKLSFNSARDEQESTVLRNISNDESSLINSEEGIQDTVLINSFVQNDDLTFTQVEKICIVDRTEKEKIDEPDTNFVNENHNITNCVTDFSHLNGSNNETSDCIVEDSDIVFNIDRVIVNENIDLFVAEEILKSKDECVKSEITYFQLNSEKSSIIEEDVLQKNECESTPNTEVDTLEIKDNIPDTVMKSHESSFDDSSSISQDKVNTSDGSILSISDLENGMITSDVSKSTKEGIPGEFDAFGDFTAFSSEHHEILKINYDSALTQPLNPPVFNFEEHEPTKKYVCDKEDSDDDDFADFASFEASSNPKTLRYQPDDDGDFGEFSSTFDSPHQPSTSQKPTKFEKSTISNPLFISLHEKEAFEKSKQIIQEMYPSFEVVLKDCDCLNLEDDAIFKQLNDFTDTPALSYHWSKSTTQKFMLKSLNIDVRNMMFGPTWNPTIPRFAAHVGLLPLEPVKADIALSANVKLNRSIPQTHSPDIPNIQFDWTSSGPVNRLEYSVDVDSTPIQHPDVLTEQIPETSLVPALKTAITSKEIVFPDDIDFQEFESYQPPTASMEWRNSLPLRETHISNISSELDIQSSIEAWLQPTIVTPELSRKTLSIDESTSTIITPEVVKENTNVQGSDDEFDDFQMVLPEKDDNQTTDHNAYSEPINAIVLDTQGSINIVQTNGPQCIESNVNQSLSDSIPPSSAQNNLTYSSAASGASKCSEENLGITNSSQDDDEFTDFHFSMPKVSNNVNTILIPSMTPLEPTPVHQNTGHTQINWPDPGLTDEELRKFENVFSSPVNFKQEIKNVSKSEILETHNDDEEWSDFVSVQKPSPIHKLKSDNDRKNTSSPDLTLSVLNLGNIQPRKLPVPIITSQGLVQTKLSSNTVSASPKLQPKNIIDTRSTYLGQQPSIISNQFASQAYNFTSVNYNNTKQVGPSKIRDSMMVSDTSQEEDEWGDFVSSPLPPKTAQNAWASQTPNIIMNPRHYVQSVSDIGKRVSNFSANKKSTVPNSLIPELDFIAPKTRTIVSRKK